jgi:hypothetical protein
MDKIKVSVKRPLGYKVEDIGPGRKATLVKSENWPVPKDNFAHHVDPRTQK